MNNVPSITIDSVPLGIGYYTAPEAARLIRTSARNINRWLGGYSYVTKGNQQIAAPLWRPEISSGDSNLELSFRDLIELRFIEAFRKAGLGLKAIRYCLELAQKEIEDERPFSTRKFITDGRTIFLESLRTSGEPELIDLKKRQYVFKTTVEASFKDLEIYENEIVSWRPYPGKKTIIIDPHRAFGQPIVAEYGVPTVVLKEAFVAEGSLKRVANLYDVSLAAVRDSIQFENLLQSA